MSYRAFKRLLGETSLERKCRFLFGAFIVLLITGSFLLYARLTENLAQKQFQTTWQLANAVVVEKQPDGRYRASCPNYPSIREGVGATEEAARLEIRKSMESYLTNATEEEMHVNRAVLFSTALI